MLERLQPSGAVSKFNERVKRIGKVNTEIADWLQERRKVEEAYVAGLKKLARKPLQEVGGDLGIFEGPWRKIIAATEEIAKSHAVLSDRIDKDVEQSLRNFTSTNREMSGIPTIQGNLSAMAKELEDAQEKSEKLARKGGKASTMKMDTAASRLQTANSQWDAQAPFIFETLQALDERRLNHLRDVLTQYETLEADQVERNRKTIESTLALLVEIDTSQEITSWAAASVAGKPITERKARQLSTAGSGTTAGTNTHMPPPQTPQSTHTAQSTHTDNHSEHSGKQESGESSKLRSRFGTMLNKRRQSIHGGFGRAPSPSKGGFVPFGRNTASRDGRPTPSPRASSNNLRESPTRDTRLSSLAESPPAMSPTSQTNGTHADSSFISDAMHEGSSTTANGTAATPYSDLSDVQPPPGPPPSHMKAVPETQTDSEGYTVPAAMTDPISQAQLDAAQESEQPQFKLDIRKEPIPEQDADAQAALSNVANTLRSSQLTPNRKAGTVRGRRDVRSTVYVPPSNSLDVANPDNAMPPSPGIPAGRAAAYAALTTGDHHSAPSVSDTTSIRSGHSLTAHGAVKHLDMHRPGLNASIIETMSATFEKGVPTSAKVDGEVALVYNKTEGDVSSTSEIIRINDFANLEVIGPNTTFIQPTSSEKSDEVTVDLAHISSKPSVAFTYRVHVDETTMARQAPLILKAAWKPQSDKLALVLEYSLNSACGVESISFSNLVLVATYQGTRGSACQTKPTGTHIKEKSLIYWRLGDVVLNNAPHKAIARITGTNGVAPEPGHIEARWEINSSIATSIGSGITLSRLEPGKGKEKETSDDPFADENLPVTPVGNWVDVETHKKFVSKKYEAR